jgi:hypothetical protein
MTAQKMQPIAPSPAKFPFLALFIRVIRVIRGDSLAIA